MSVYAESKNDAKTRITHLVSSSFSAFFRMDRILILDIKSHLFHPKN